MTKITSILLSLAFFSCATSSAPLPAPRVHRSELNAPIDVESDVIFGVRYGARESEIVRILGTPYGTISFFPNEKGLVYARNAILLLRDDSFYGLRISYNLIDFELSQYFYVLSMTKIDSWSLTNGLHRRMQINDALQVLGDRAETSEGAIHFSTKTSNITISEIGINEETGDIQWELDEINITRLGYPELRRFYKKGAS